MNKALLSVYLLVYYNPIPAAKKPCCAEILKIFYLQVHVLLLIALELYA